jgi:hypothetical protein
MNARRKHKDNQDTARFRRVYYSQAGAELTGATPRHIRITIDRQRAVRAVTRAQALRPKLNLKLGNKRLPFFSGRLDDFLVS